MLVNPAEHRRQDQQKDKTDREAAEHVRRIMCAQVQSGKCNQPDHDKTQNRQDANASLLQNSVHRAVE